MAAVLKPDGILLAPPPLAIREHIFRDYRDPVCFPEVEGCFQNDLAVRVPNLNVQEEVILQFNVTDHALLAVVCGNVIVQGSHKFSSLKREGERERERERKGRGRETGGEGEERDREGEREGGGVEFDNFISYASGQITAYMSGR